MIEQTQAQQTQAQAPKRPASSVPLLVGGAFFAGIAAFLGWGVWEATHPAPVPLQGMVDARTISVSAKVPGRLAELKVREGDVLKAGDTVAVIAIPEIEAKLVQVKAQERAAQAREDLANTGARVQERMRPAQTGSAPRQLSPLRPRPTNASTPSTGRASSPPSAMTRRPPSLQPHAR